MNIYIIIRYIDEKTSINEYVGLDIDKAQRVALKIQSERDASIYQIWSGEYMIHESSIMIGENIPLIEIDEES